MSSSSQFVSVVIPAFNAERHIAQTLESVLAQTYRRLEVIVVDDGSVDRTSEIVRSYARKDARLQLISQQNQGVAAARNRAIAESRGQFIAPIDADDLWFPSKIQRQVDVLSKSPAIVGLVYVWSQRIDESGAAVGDCSGEVSAGPVYLLLLLGNFIGNSSSPLIRRECFETVRGYDESFRQFDAQGCEDWDLYLRIAERYQFSVIADCLVKYRQTVDGMSTNTEKMEKSHRLLLNSVRNRHPSISSFIYRWSTSAYLLYVANICTRNAETGKALISLVRAAYLDPGVILNRRLHTILVKSVARVLAISDRLPGKRRLQAGETTFRGTAGDASGTLWSHVRNKRHDQLLELQHILGLDAGATPQPPSGVSATGARRVRP